MQTVQGNIKVPEVLLIEDNLSDVILVKKALSGCALKVKLNAVGDGAEAMDYLHQKGLHRSERIPDLVILDMNLPKRSGLDILREIKETPRLNHIPVVMLTTSGSDKDIIKTYGLGATCFVTKPMNFEVFAETIHCIVDNFILPQA